MNLSSSVSYQYCGWPDKPHSDVWSVRVDGEMWYLEQLDAEPIKFDRNAAAYQDWIPRLRGSLPDLVASDLSLKALLLTTAVPGSDYVPDSREYSPSQYAQVRRRAGELIRPWHQLPARAPGRSRAEVAANECQRWTETPGWESAVGSSMRRWVESVLGDFAEFDRMPVTPCYRGYEARNWIVDPSARRLPFGVIDFDRAGMDTIYIDLRWVWRESPHSSAAHGEAFFEGFLW